MTGIGSNLDIKKSLWSRARKFREWSFCTEQLIKRVAPYLPRSASLACLLARSASPSRAQVYSYWKTD